MLRMLEVVGRSPSGYSEATRAAIETLIENGEKIHFFEVIAQRGAVRDSIFREFQVILKVAVE